MEDLRPGELEGLTKRSITRLPPRARALKVAGFLLMPGTLLVVWAEMMVTRTYSKPQLIWLGTSTALGLVAWALAQRSEVFCKGCDRRPLKRSLREVRSETEYYGTITICRPCQAYEEFLTTSD